MNNDNFELVAFPNQVHFGKGKISVLTELIEANYKALVIGSSRINELVQGIQSELGEEKIFHFDKVIQHVPISLVDQVEQVYRDEQCDVLVAIGGGSAIGLAKALALRVEVKIIAIPTTYAGSEMTNIWGISMGDGGKTTGRDNAVLPAHVIYDSNLTIGMPAHLAGTSAMNAMAHLMESIYAHDTNPVTYINSLYGVKQLMQGMEILSKEKKLTQASNELFLLGAFLAGKGLCEVSMSLHHKAAHVLGGSFGMEHSHVHTVIQAFVLEYQWPFLSKPVQEDFKAAFNSHYPPQAILEAVKKIGASESLEQIGFKQADIEKAADIILKKPYANPAPVTREGLVDMLQKAFVGKLSGVVA